MSKEHVKIKTAKLLKEKGFNEPVDSRFNRKGEYERNLLGREFYKHNSGEVCKIYLSAPSFFIAEQWLLQNHNILIVPVLKSINPFTFTVKVWKDETEIIFLQGKKVCESKNEALEEGIVFALNLIKLS